MISIKDAEGRITKKFGEGTLMRLGDNNIIPVDVIPSGSLALDRALGVGGIPRGRITEIFGPESSGKTTVCQHIVANAQWMGLSAYYIDMEHALDLKYAAACGVNVSDLVVSQPDNGEQALEIVDTMLLAKGIGVIIIDSVAALVPRAEIEGEMGDSHMGLQARLMSQAMRKMAVKVQPSNAAVVFTNQLRMKIGVVFGNPEVTTGGNALKFYAAVRLDIRRSQAVKDGDEQTGNSTKVRVVKNKVANPSGEAKFDIMFGKGISRLGELVDLGSELGVITKKGAFYSYGDTRIGQGRDNARSFLESNPEMALKVEHAIRESFRTSTLPVVETPTKPEEEPEL